ncbi:uncharacterized protein LOC129744107 [Uranotaenia lowii]|uniref:uncharacterized protein LOC129744107 n=1 Tax=Uranotaenia lowii TaxID=190385 RepID=UPI00247AD045|nr:uncharacterized protein LOC129744107 [Uranotaenia lowii]
MSKSLAKKALLLAEEGLDGVKLDAKIGKAHSRRNDSELIPQHHKMVKFVGKKGQKQAKELLKRPRNVTTVVEARKRLQNRKDNTEDNIRKLLLLSSAKIGDEASAKMIKRAQTGRYVVKATEFLPKKEKSKESAFTEDDFKMFEEELAKC